MTTAMRSALALFLVLHLSAAFDAQAQEVNAFLDRNPVYEGDTVTLTIEINDATQSPQPDLSPLAKDFQVLRTSTSTQIQIINGQQSAKTQWLIQLQPNHNGTIEIPALRIGANQTSPLSLTVESQPPAVAKQLAERLFIHTEVEDQNPYVQSQIRFVVKLFYAVPLLDGELEELKLDNAVVERLDEDRIFSTTLNNRRYQALERRYAVFPEQSGALQLPSIRFRGRIATENSRRPSAVSPLDFRRAPSISSPFSSLFGSMFDPGQPVSVASDAITLNVRPRPDDYNGDYWLPSESVALSDSWAQNPPQFRVGEPVTRTITVEAKGLSAAHLPALDTIITVDKANVYPEQPITKNRTDGVWIYGQRKQSLAIVPNQAGILTLPEIRLAWWDTLAEEQRITSLPAREFQVLPAASDATQTASETPKPLSKETITPQTQKQVDALTTPLLSNIWLWINGLLLLAWLATLSAWIYTQRRNPTPKQPDAGAAHETDAIRRKLQQACSYNDARSAAGAVLDWAAILWPRHAPKNLGTLAARLSAEQQTAVRTLDEALYARDATHWDGAVLWQALAAGFNTKQPVYPQSTTLLAASRG